MPQWLLPAIAFGLAFAISLRVGPARLRALTGAMARGGAVSVFILALVFGSIPSLLHRTHPPFVHDEFSYLLAADTFLHGRLTNPTPPFWEHFETFHELMVPTYASKFPPGQGLALALGRLAHLPVDGAWVVVAIGCAAVAWALRAWVSNAWATFGGLVLALHPLIWSWGQSYWGGGVALLGGALLFGGAGRVARRGATHAARSASIAALGCALLAMSRPLEGLLTIILLAVALLPRLLRRPQALRHALPSAIAVIALTAAFLGYYNFRVTGSVTTFPYVVHTRQYMAAPLLWWQGVSPPPAYHNEKLRQFHVGYELNNEYANQAREPIESAPLRLWSLVTSWTDPWLLALPMIAAAIVLWMRRRTAGFAWWMTLSVPLAHVCMTPWIRPQYMAPIATAFALVIVIGTRRLVGRFRYGYALPFALLAAVAVACGFEIAQFVSVDRPSGTSRQEIVERLTQEPGQHLVLVRYSPGIQQMFEFVYNDADIERSKIVWARVLDDPSDAPLVQHFANRRLWLLNVDGASLSFSEVHR